jgi:carbamate kinase
MPEILQRVVVALGGNAISSVGEQGTIEEQFAHTQHAVRVVCDVIEDGYQLVITHGNGPQVGNVLRRVELARRELYPLPLEVCVADTQAGMGYMIAQCVMNELAGRGQSRLVTTVVTTVLVDAEDPAFVQYTKPIGPRLNRDVAEAHQSQDGWHIREVTTGSFQRLVPSPKPVEILEFSTIARLIEAGEIVVCCGGGGIPVVRDSAGCYQGAAAVIDKDLTTAMLAGQLGASKLVILTAVDQVYIDYQRPGQRALSHLTAAEAGRYLAEGQFGAGSMQPKVEAAIDFVTQSPSADAVAIIARLDQFADALAGNRGTWIVKQ